MSVKLCSTSIQPCYSKSTLTTTHSTKNRPIKLDYIGQLNLVWTVVLFGIKKVYS